MELKKIIDELAKNIQSNLPWDKLICRDGETQKKERKYIPTLIEEIEKLGGTIGSHAGSQEPMDLRDVSFVSSTGNIFKFDLDGKSVNSGLKFKFNDSRPKLDGFYCFIKCDTKQVIMKSGEEIYRNMFVDNYDEFILKLETHEQLVKKFRDVEPFGNGSSYITSYARLSWDVKLDPSDFGIDVRTKKNFIELIIKHFDGKWPSKVNHEGYCNKNSKKEDLKKFWEHISKQSN